MGAFRGYKKEFETVEECLDALKRMYERYYAVGYCEVGVLDESLCLNPWEWVWTNLGTIHIQDHGQTICIMHCPTAKAFDDGIDKLDISAELFKILQDNHIERVWQLVDGYKRGTLRMWNVGPVREAELKEAMDKFMKEVTYSNGQS